MHQYHCGPDGTCSCALDHVEPNEMVPTTIGDRYDDKVDRFLDNDNDGERLTMLFVFVP